MKVSMTGEEYSKGVGEFLSVYYKDWMRSKSFKDLSVIFLVSVSLLIMLGFTSGDIKSSLILVGILLGGLFIIFLSVFVMSRIIKNKKYNITKVEYEFIDKIYATSYIGEESTNKEQYSYDSILKVIEAKEYFYLFVSKYAALTIKKTEEFDRNDFIELMIDKKIAVKEYK